MWLVKFKSSPPVWSLMAACDTITVHDSLKPSAHTHYALCARDSILCGIYLPKENIKAHTWEQEIIRPVFSSGAHSCFERFFLRAGVCARCDFETLANPNVQTSGSESCCSYMPLTESWCRRHRVRDFFPSFFWRFATPAADGIWMRKVAFLEQNLAKCVANSSKIYWQTVPLGQKIRQIHVIILPFHHAAGSPGCRTQTL